ncbi:urease [Rhizoctonia solani AG-1 IA]|uniref:Urease n=1 Tax=Thanatephorus cucumeris (strain AG1-IA) TaxID=983506 RepID=L8WN44_THACA|nr:urease [Rhizoctonia solani AG-1 IA]
MRSTMLIYWIPPREHDKLLLHQLGALAQKRLARGLKLNHTEATALIATQLQEYIRDGNHTVDELMDLGKRILGRRHVLPSVPALLHEIQVEGTFPDGVFLVTVHNPICSDSGDLAIALYGSFLPIPSEDTFELENSSLYANDAAPGAVIVRREPIVINQGRDRIRLKVTNKGDRPIQVGSHYHFIETNAALDFDRGKAYGKRLDIPAGTAVRFEPGDPKYVNLVSIGGAQVIRGGNNLASGKAQLSRTDEIVKNLLACGFAHTPEPGALSVAEPNIMTREAYTGMFGPTTGDRVRLGDTEVQTVYGDECKFGGGKVLREGMGQAASESYTNVLDLLITNALIIDWSGIYKGDIGISGGKIVGIGKAGNPDVMEGVTPNLIAGTNTEVIAGEKLIITAGAIDAHVHYICPQQWQEQAIASGTTTMIGGGTGPSAGTNATTCTPSPFYMRHMLAATDSIPINFLFTGKGNDASPAALEEIVQAGAAGLKLHEVGLNQGEEVMTSSQLAPPFSQIMLMVCHHLDKSIPEDCAFADSRIRQETIAAEDVLHDLGAIAMISSDSQAMGRVGEVVSRTWRTASKMRELRGPLANDGDEDGKDNARVKRYVSNAITHGISHLVGQVKEGCLADLVLWRPENFGAKPEMVLKSGVIAWAQSITDGGRECIYPNCPTGLFASYVGFAARLGGIELCCVCFKGFHHFRYVTTGHSVYEFNLDPHYSYIGAIQTYGLSKRPEAVLGCRSIRKKDMKWNNSTPKMSVDPETYAVHADGVLADVPPALTLPLTRAYNVF